jgi:hypothetical protein
MVVVRPFDGKIAVGTHGNGVYTGSLPAVEAAAVNEISKATENKNPWPNPFHSYVQIPISVADRTNVRLDIYDMVGNLVYSKKINSNTTPSSAVNWSPSADLAEGTYLYTITSDTQKSSGRLIYKR